ncbi:MAG: PQQ-binding-like beta-propeller repeat protein [Verrucomicrobiae bacterium]|nr:PQQ-binding-like beta-propeller repeat protein [Verrucomicrobiae bacterium]
MIDTINGMLENSEVRFLSLTSMTCLVALAVLPSHSVKAEDWPQWRGPGRDGVFHESGIDEALSAKGLEIRWRVPVGWGFASPVVAQGRVFLADSEVSKPSAKERLHCLEESTGRTLWTHAYDVVYEDWAYDPTQEIGPVATPIVEEGKVYTVGRVGDLYCLETSIGRALWRRNLAKDYDVAFSAGMPSPLIEGDKLILFIGGKPEACVVALEKDTGKEIWKALDESLTFSSPIVVSVGGKRQLIVWTQESVTSLDPATGTTNWRQRLLTSSDYAVSTPVFQENKLLIGGMMFVLDPDEASATVLWPDSKARSQRIFSHTSTAMIQGGHVYSARSSGELICVNADTGRQIWETDQVTDLKNGASIHLTPIGDSVLLYTDRGELIRARLTPEGYKEMSRVAVIDPTFPFAGRKVAWSPPAYANQHLFVRSGNELVCASLATSESMLDDPAKRAEQKSVMSREFNAEGYALRQAKTDEERAQIVARVERLTRHYLAQAEMTPGTATAMDALTQVVDQEIWMENHSTHSGWGPESPEVRAIALLRRDHIGSVEADHACWRMSYGFRKECETFLRAVFESNPHREVRGRAGLRLAQFLNSRLRRLELLKEQPNMAHRYELLFGKDYLDELQGTERSEAINEVEAIFEQCAKDYAEVPLSFGGTVGEKAASELHEIRHLTVGAMAQEIEGDDQDGIRFKLSDYRGKVVLLYFWSEY